MEKRDREHHYEPRYVSMRIVSPSPEAPQPTLHTKHRHSEALLSPVKHQSEISPLPIKQQKLVAATEKGSKYENMPSP
jgi:hypothetical protein